MKSLSSVGLGLSVVFTFLFLALIAELYYLLWWKKRLTSNRSDIESPAKELFYTLCWRKPQRQRSSTNDKPFAENDRNQCPPRFLFTIIEETKEDLESEDGKACRSRNRSLSDLLVALETPYLTPLASPPFLTPPLTPGGLPLSNGQVNGFNSVCEVEPPLSSSSPPLKLGLLREAEEKVKKTNENEEEEEEEEGFITITVDHKSNTERHNSSSTSGSQVLPLCTSSSPD